MKNFLKSSALAGVFFIVHWSVQNIFTVIYANLKFGIDVAGGTLKKTGRGTFLYKNAEVSEAELSKIYGSIASVPGIILTAVFLVVAYCLVFKLSKKDFKGFINIKKLSIKQYFYGFMLGVTLFLPVIFIISSTFIKDLSPEIGEAFQNILSNTPFLLKLLGVGIFGPIIEEITFRGLVYSSFKKSVPVIPAIMFQALLFGLMHMNLQQFIYATMIGILFGFVLEWSGSIIITILAHIGFNTFSLISDEIFMGLSKIFPDQQLALVFVLILSVSAVSCYNIIHLFYKNREELCNDNNIGQK